MEDKNLPEIGFKKEKKKGFLPWLKQRLGFGNSASMGNSVSAGNVGLTGAKTGLSVLLAAKSVLVPLAIVAVIGGTTIYVKNQNNTKSQEESSIGDSSKATNTNYVPAILREQNKNTGSSLDIFKQAAKGKISLDEKPVKPADVKKEEKPSESAEQGDMPQDNPMGDMAAALQGTNQQGLSTEIGSSNKFSAMGGFGQKQGLSQKVGFTNFGGNFSTLPKFQDRKNKLLAMSGNKKITVGKGNMMKGIKDKSSRSASLNQAMSIRATQKQYKGNKIDSLRSTQDAAWESTTGDGEATGGSGLSDGGAGLVQTPSAINEVSDYNKPNPDINIPTNFDPDKDNPWGDKVDKAMKLLAWAAGLSALASYLVKWGRQLIVKGNAMHPVSTWLIVAGLALVAAGISLAVTAISYASQVMGIGKELKDVYAHKELGNMFVIAGATALVGATLAMVGAFKITIKGFVFNASLYSLYFAGAVGIMALLASMSQTKVEEKYLEQSSECQMQGKHMDEKTGNCV